jgi:hypothetical protein
VSDDALSTIGVGVEGVTQQAGISNSQPVS